MQQVQADRLAGIIASTCLLLDELHGGGDLPAAAHVVVAGVQTPNCVRATAFDAVAEEFADVSVLADATASATPAVQEANLADLRAAGVHTPTLGQWRASLAGPGLLGALFGR